MSASAAAQAIGTRRYWLERRASTQKISPAVFASAAWMAREMRSLSACAIHMAFHQLPHEPPPPQEPPPPEKPPPPENPPSENPPEEPDDQPPPPSQGLLLPRCDGRAAPAMLKKMMRKTITIRMSISIEPQSGV